MQDCEDLENTVSGGFLLLEKKLYDFCDVFTICYPH